MTKITDDITYLGVNDQKTDLFESLWPLEQGVSYNSYLVSSQQTALIDSVDSQFADQFLAKLKSALNGKTLDCAIINHMEPDHSGLLKELCQLYPDLKIIGNQKTASFVKGFYHLNKSKVKIIKSGSELDLGGLRLRFIQTPMVHWPESMITYQPEQKVLFSSDIFGGFKSLGQGIFASDYSDLSEFQSEARRYFSNVIGAYTRPTQRALKTVNDLEIKIVAPGHGLIWKQNPATVLNWYQQWSEMEAEAGVALIYGSMYGYTQEIASTLAKQLKEEGVAQVKELDAARTHVSELLNAVWQYQGLIIGSSTYTNNIFPPIRELLASLAERRIEKRQFGFFGSYSWTGGAYKALQSFAQDSKMELVEPSFRSQYSLTEDKLSDLKSLAHNMAAALKS